MYIYKFTHPVVAAARKQAMTERALARKNNKEASV